MANYNWAFYSFILLTFLAFLMLVTIFISAVIIKPSNNPDVLKYFNTDFLTTASSYNKAALLISVLQRLISWIFMFGIIFIFWKNFYSNSRIPILLACGIFALFNIILYIILFPLQYYRGFVLEHRFGLSKQTFYEWFLDILKDKAISLLINTFILTIIYILIIHLHKNWWLAASAIFILFLVIAIFIFPILIDPLFYNFKELEDKELKDEIIKIAGKADIHVDKILVADASRKTTRINAYFTGMGKTKRIVIYDNLLNKSPKNEVLSVIAHEIGHWKYKHIFISLIIGSASIILLLFILKLFQLGLNLNVSVKSVLILFILFSLISYITIPFQNYISRKFEEQADYIALKLTGDLETQINIFKKLAISNLSNVKPSPVLKFIIFSHPPVIERINNAIDNFYEE